MEIYLTRDRVATADDIDAGPKFVAPPDRRFEGSLKIDFADRAERSPDDVYDPMVAFVESRRTTAPPSRSSAPGTVEA